MFPGCPPDEARAIAEHACQENSGRVGRSAAAKEFDPAALRLAVIAHIRHLRQLHECFMVEQAIHSDQDLAFDAPSVY